MNGRFQVMEHPQCNEAYVVVDTKYGCRYASVSGIECVWQDKEEAALFAHDINQTIDPMVNKKWQGSRNLRRTVH